MLYGMFFYSASAIFYFISSKFIGTGLAMIMYFFYPAIVLIYNAIFYKTSIPPIYYKMFLVMLVGMVLLVDLSDLKVHLIGITIGFLASVGYALYVIHSKNTPLAPIVSSFMVSLGCMFTCFGFAIIDSSFIIPGQSSEWGYLVALSLICTSIPILLLLQGLKYISSAKASLLSVLEPVTVIILGVTLLGETIIFSQLIGIILVLFSASVIAVNRSSSE
jgi:drug/metabolite transporter (DMT)-like permease